MLGLQMKKKTKNLFTEQLYTECFLLMAFG